MNRREFVGTLTAGAAAVALGSVSFELEGCMFSSIENDILNYVPVVLQAVSAILDLVSPTWAAVVTTFTPLIDGGLAALQKAIADWEAADAAQKPGLWGAIIATLQTVQTDLQNLLGAVQVNAPKVYSVVEALAGIVLGVLQYFLNKLQGTASSKSVTLHVGSGQLQVEPLNYSPTKFRTVWNAKCVSLGHPEAAIK